MRFRAIPVRCRYLEVVCNVIAGAAPIDLTCGSVEHKNTVMDTQDETCSADRGGKTTKGTNPGNPTDYVVTP